MAAQQIKKADTLSVQPLTIVVENCWPTSNRRTKKV